ncbi:nucleic acid dioxygenase ALKBH1 isoform X1 [Prorops nasuta]|uniref:nucleic acid dioxygenase ALKBH1 isoform X1 n=1 Tax=Prorops nasuta TaxID=863751 RepID=UPI0034CE2A13
MFKDSFKYYKSRNPFPDLKNVIDIDSTDYTKVRPIEDFLLKYENRYDLGLRPTKDWKIYELKCNLGLIFIQNPFTAEGQQYWITKCLKDYPKKPNKLNLDEHKLLNDNTSWWEECFKNSDGNVSLLTKLRWTTLGYHHDWNTKHYSENSKSILPSELCNLTTFLANVLNYTGFNAEAIIINYYRMNSTLAGHTDHSEVNIEAPLFSISFGQNAIFLIGGLTQEEPATPIYLRSGDIVVMSKTSRHCYHGIPKILPTLVKPWMSNDSMQNKLHSEVDSEDWSIASNYISEARININVRQVLKPGQIRLL